jgi:methylated-DNA-protein-cysteine methyltransferase related protein
VSSTRGKRGAPSDDPYARIYAAVRRIPRGKVATYGQIAQVAGLANHARQVGYALHALTTGSDVPWHRVVNARGEVSLRAAPGWDDVQRDLLEQEDVLFGLHDRIDLGRYGWKPRAARPPARRKPAPRRRSRAILHVAPGHSRG